MMDRWITKYLVCLLTIILLLSFHPSFAQSAAEYIQQGENYQERDQLDAAELAFEQAFQSKDPDIRLQAIGGLISLALQKAELSLADSLVSRGEQMLQSPGISLASLAEFTIKKGEYFRKNSQFQQALIQHQEAARLSRDLENAAVIHADALFYIAMTFERLGSYDSSLAYLNQAYPIYLENLDTTTLKFSSIYNGMGNTHYRLNRYEEAKKYYLKSKEVAEKRLGAVSSNLAIALGNLSSIYRAEQNYPQAVASSEQALKIHRKLKDESGISSDYYALGVYRYFMGDYGRTKDYMESCIALREKLYNKKHYSLIGPYEVLGIAYEESGDYEKTLYYLKKARPVIEANFGESSLASSQNYENTALCFKNINQLDSALYYIKLANAIQVKEAAENDYVLGVHYFNYANILYLLNDLAGAREMVKRCDQVYTNLGMNTSSEYAQNLALYGKMASEEYKWTEADIWFEKALDILSLPAQPEEQIKSFLLTPNSLWLINEYSDYLYQKYQFTKDPGSLKKFENYSNIYLDLSDKFRKQFIDPYTKSILIKDNAEVYNRNIGIYHQLFQQSGDSTYLKAAYKFSEYGRASLLRDIQDDKIQAYAGLPDTILQKEGALKKKITQLNQQLLDDPASETLKKELFSAKEALNTFIDRILDEFPAYYDLKFNTSIPSLEEIKSRLDKDENLIEYMQDDTAYYALVIHPENTGLLYLGNRMLINEQIKRWKTALVNQDEETVQDAGTFLYQQLWQPLEPSLSGNRVTVIPSGPLFYLNFETLPLDPSSFLIERYNLTYALSFHLLFSESQQKEGNTIFAIAPGFEDVIKEQYQTQLDSMETPDPEFLNTVRQPWSLKLISYLKRKFSPFTLIGTKATESNVKANIQKGKVLYFGTHAIANPSDPLRSKLVLAKEMGLQKEDGYLHAYEFFGLPLEAELAILNACESGLGNLQAGEGMISLAYSLHFAGCPSTVMSLWKVDEKISTGITQSLIDYLDQGYAKSEALRQAKLDYLEVADPMLRQPFYWGGMVMMGKDGPVELKKKPFTWLILLPLIVGVIIYFRWKRTRNFKAKPNPS